MISSISNVPATDSDFTGLPVTIISNAFSAPTARGKRCVPPAPGRMPSFTSGNASWAPASATR